MPRGTCRRHGSERPCSCAMGNLYRFTEPVVLYLLEKHGPSHGYELASALQGHTLTDSQIERAALYRTLQQLEANGHVVSSWDVTGRGPARHMYALTPQGENHLRDWQKVLENLSSSLLRFLEEMQAETPASEVRTDTRSQSSLSPSTLKSRS
jgi:PadR family transcriptional regulator, regulatory protein PadR